MAALNQCPKCERKGIESVLARPVAVELAELITPIRGFTFECPHCGTILGCQIDPSTADILAAIKRATQE